MIRRLVRRILCLVGGHRMLFDRYHLPTLDNPKAYIVRRCARCCREERAYEHTVEPPRGYLHGRGCRKCGGTMTREGECLDCGYDVS